MLDERNAAYAETLGALIRRETVSVRDEANEEKFLAFHALLEETFPHLFAACEKEVFGGSLLLRWKGSGSKRPLLLMSHMDVVAASGEWTHPPFSGEIADGRLWGRGTLDNKGNLFAIMQAAEELAADSYSPERDIYFESSSTEETDGSGADAISRALEARGIRFYMTLDEGGMILHDPIGGADGDFAMIGVGEKGCTALKFVARSRGGHASTPGRNTPLVRLGRFMAAVEDRVRFTLDMPDVISEMLTRLAPTMSGAMKLVCARARGLSPLLKRVMPRLSPSAKAMLQTTVAFTMAKGSDGVNVLPEEAYVIGDMRFSHHEGNGASVAKLRAVAKEYDIEVETVEEGFASGITDYEGEPFKLVERAVSEIFPGVRPAPYIMTGASDSRYFSRVSDDCIRFAPFKIDGEQLSGIHARNENVNADSLAQAVDFFKYIIREA